MQTDLQIVWERMDPSDFVRERIEREVARLEKLFGRVTSCHVFVEAPGHRHHQGGLYAVRVRLELPGGKEISASRNPSQDQAHEDAYVAIRDVFDALKEQLREQVRVRRDVTRQADSQPHGIISSLAPDNDHGFIRADDGREIYFHRNAVLTDVAKLRVGADVHFSEEEGEQGPQASSVRAYGVGTRSN